MASTDLRCGSLQQFLARDVQQRDTSFHVGCDQPAANGVNHVFMEGLQSDQLAAAIVKPAPRFSQLGGQSAGEMGHSKIGKQVGEDHNLQGIQIATRRTLKCLQLGEIVERQHSAEKNRRQHGGQISPVAREYDTGDDDHQWIEEVEKTVDAARNVHHDGDERQVSENLGDRLESVLMPQSSEHDEKNGNRVPHQHDRNEKARGNVIPREIDNEQFHGQQNRNDDDTDFDKP